MSIVGRNPYLIEGPALVSFSGGRTSGYMLKHILDAHDGTLPEDVHVVFANTGKEMPETLDFVQECGDRWGVRIVWLEHRFTDAGSHSFEIVNHNSASRDGQPFKELIDNRGFLPNPVTRFCTVELKIRTMARYGLSLGLDEFDKVVGLRADEWHRVSRMRNRAEKSGEKGERDIIMPLADAAVTKWDVRDFWNKQSFDLRLPNVNGKTPLGNCDLCFLKGASTLLGIVRERPDLAKWWAEAEAEARASKPLGARFRNDRPSYAAMIEMNDSQGDMFDWLDDNTMPCLCTD